MADEIKNPNLRTDSGEQYEVPAEGSLGLLAMGYKGLMLWRKKRFDAAKAKAEQISIKPK